MVQRRNRAGFLPEPAHAVLVGHQPTRQDLEGDLPPKAQILREIDLAHAAGAERRDHAIVRKLLSGRRAPARSSIIAFPAAVAGSQS